MRGLGALLAGLLVLGAAVAFLPGLLLDDPPPTANAEGGTPATGSVPAGAPADLAEADREALEALLDGFHAAAARADGDDYFGRFAADALFVGTDPAEVWTVEAFRAYAAPHFAAGQGWSYRPVARKWVTLGADAAAFHEQLDNAKYGRVRGSGAVVRGPAGWRIGLYVLSFEVPNDRAPAVLEALATPPSADGANPGGD